MFTGHLNWAFEKDHVQKDLTRPDCASESDHHVCNLGNREAVYFLGTLSSVCHPRSNISCY